MMVVLRATRAKKEKVKRVLQEDAWSAHQTQTRQHRQQFSVLVGDEGVDLLNIGAILDDASKLIDINAGLGGLKDRLVSGERLDLNLLDDNGGLSLDLSENLEGLLLNLLSGHYLEDKGTCENVHEADGKTRPTRHGGNREHCLPTAQRPGKLKTIYINYTSAKIITKERGGKAGRARG